MKLIVLVNQNLNQTNLKRFNLKLNKNIQFKKIYWSILPLNNKNLFLEYEKKEYRPKKNKNFINLKSYFEVYKNLKKINNETYFINQSGNYLKSLLIEIILRLKGCKIVKKIDGYNYILNKEKFSTRLARLYEFGFIFTLNKIFKSSLSLVKIYFLNIFSAVPDYYIVENQQSVEELQRKKINKFIKINSFTFSEFHKIRSNKSSKNYFVFLDSEIENSFESKILNNRHSEINHFKYWRCLDKIFDELSYNLKTNVKIASHFRRSKNNCPLKEKDFYFDQTLNLIKNSKFVVAHNTSAIDWAVLFKKPILLLNFKIFDSISLENSDSIKFYADRLSLETINIDLDYSYTFDKKKLRELLKINQKKYQRFSNFYLNYQRNQFPYLNQWEILYKYFKQKIINVK